MHISTPKQLKELQKKYQDKEDKLFKKIIVCHGPGCLASGAEKIFEEFKRFLSKKKIKGVTLEALKKTGCHGLCEKAPLVAIEPAGILYTRVKPRHVEDIIEKTVKGDEVIIQKRVSLVLSADHRVINGKYAADFLSCIVEELENL